MACIFGTHRVRTAPGPYPPDLSRSTLEGRKRRFLAYSFPSRSPGPHHLAVLAHPGFVRAAPALPGTTRVRLPPAATGLAVKVSHLHSDQQRLTAHSATAEYFTCRRHTGPLVPMSTSSPRECFLRLSQPGYLGNRHTFVSRCTARLYLRGAKRGANANRQRATSTDAEQRLVQVAGISSLIERRPATKE